MAPTDLLDAGCLRPSICKRCNTYKVQWNEARLYRQTSSQLFPDNLRCFQSTDKGQISNLTPGPSLQLRSLTAYAAHSLNCSCNKSLPSARHATANRATVWSSRLSSAEYARSLNLTQSDHSHHSRPYDVFHAQSTYPARMTQEG